MWREMVPLAALLLAACASPPPAPVAPAAAQPPVVDVAAINKPYRELKEQEVDPWVDRFERESREIYAQRLRIADAVALRPGDRVADVGCGTGLFEPLFSLAVGPVGRVVAVDIAPLFLDHVRDRAREETLWNVTTLLGDEHSTRLPAASVDVVFLCDTYHHFEHPQETLASIHAALVPGGRLVVVDFRKIAGVSSEFVMGHVRADEATVRGEIEAAGFAQARREEFLKENWFLEFRRVER
jgi:ubiquinone/menaquinone biosynthesis C-methylase UbiE